MEKSMRLMLFQVIGAAVVCGLSVAGTGSSSSIMNNSLNPYTPLTVGSVSTSTAYSMLETYLQTFPINEQQNILTTAYHHSAKHSTSTVGSAPAKEKPTTSSVSSYSSTTASATESSQYSSASSNTLSPFLIGSSTYASVIGVTGNLSENPEQPVLIPAGPILLGCGPNNREGIGIQKALDWLREKRVSDYGWENDTHMVILAKEVSAIRNFLGKFRTIFSVLCSFQMAASPVTTTGTCK